MPGNYGVKNEEDFVFEINNHKFKDLNKNLQYFIHFIFSRVKDDDVLRCYKTEDYIKPDICIEWTDQRAFVSLKYGVSDTIHGESLQSFNNFLRSLGVEERIIKTILLFNYGDGTIDGTGERRKNGLEIRYELKDEIEYLNAKLNESKEFVKAVVSRLLFDGVNPLAYKAQYVYHGNIEYGDIVSKNQVMKHIDRKNWDFMDCPHIGPIVFRPHARYSEKQILNEKFRHELKFTWPNLLSDIRYISKRYTY